MYDVAEFENLILHQAYFVVSSQNTPKYAFRIPNAVGDSRHGGTCGIGPGLGIAHARATVPVASHSPVGQMVGAILRCKAMVSPVPGLALIFMVMSRDFVTA